jgi:hypothetical protein
VAGEEEEQQAQKRAGTWLCHTLSNLLAPMILGQCEQLSGLRNGALITSADSTRNGKPVSITSRSSM